MKDLTHVDKDGQAHMVDISEKQDSKRVAIASGLLKTTSEVVELIEKNALKKGDCLATARIAGIMAAKKTHDLIPLCHPLPISSISIDFELHETSITIHSTVSTIGKTGVEMEALTAVSVAALTIYDMCKAVDKSMTIEDIKLIKKTGGKSGDYKRG